MPDVDTLRALAFQHSPADQHRLAALIAENVGYELTPDPLRGAPSERTDDWDAALDVAAAIAKTKYTSPPWHSAYETAGKMIAAGILALKRGTPAAPINPFVGRHAPLDSPTKK